MCLSMLFLLSLLSVLLGDLLCSILSSSPKWPRSLGDEMGQDELAEDSASTCQPEMPLASVEKQMTVPSLFGS